MLGRIKRIQAAGCGDSSSAPLGRPVVPDVYCRLIGSPGRELPFGFLQPLAGQFPRRPLRGPARRACRDVPSRGCGRPTASAGTSRCGVRRAGRRPIPDRPPAAYRNRRFERCRSISASPRTSDWASVYSSSAARYAGIDGHQDHADAGRGELQQHPLRPVRGPNAEVVAPAQSDGQQAAGDAIDFPVELGPRQADSRLGEDHRVAVGKPPGRLPQRRPDGQTLDPRLALPGSRALEEAFQPTTAKVAEEQIGKYFAFPCQSRVAPATEPFLDGRQNCRQRRAMPAAERQPPARRPQERPRPGFRPSAASRQKVRPLPPQRFFVQPGGNELLQTFIPPVGRPGRIEQSNCQCMPHRELSAGKQHRQGRRQPHQFGQALGASPGRQQAQA